MTLALGLACSSSQRQTETTVATDAAQCVGQAAKQASAGIDVISAVTQITELVITAAGNPSSLLTIGAQILATYGPEIAACVYADLAAKHAPQGGSGAPTPTGAAADPVYTAAVRLLAQAKGTQ